MIIITKKDGRVVNDKIRGSDKRIIDNVNDLNFLNSCDENFNLNDQIVKVNIVRDGMDIPGCIQRNIEYTLNYNEESKCYLY